MPSKKKKGQALTPEQRQKLKESFGYGIPEKQAYAQMELADLVNSQAGDLKSSATMRYLANQTPDYPVLPEESPKAIQMLNPPWNQRAEQLVKKAMPEQWWLSGGMRREVKAPPQPLMVIKEPFIVERPKPPDERTKAQKRLDVNQYSPQQTVKEADRIARGGMPHSQLRLPANQVALGNEQSARRLLLDLIERGGEIRGENMAKMKMKKKGKK